MSNLDGFDRFHGASETRWPHPALHGEPSGANRKALSRYIDEYLIELDKSDRDLWKSRKEMGMQLSMRQIPEHWAPHSLDTNTALPMNRTEYIMAQNKLFREMTGYNSWSDLSAQQAAADAKDKHLMSTIEMYMAALDDKIYMSADYTRAILGVRDKRVRDEYENLTADRGKPDYSEEAEKKKFLEAVIELRLLFRELWTSNRMDTMQREQLETEMQSIRYEHALQYSKALRLEHATHSLGQRLIDAQKYRHQNETLKEELSLEQQNHQLTKSSLEGMSAKYEAQSEELRRLKQKEEEPTDLERKIHDLYEQTRNLKISDSVLEEEEPKDALEALHRALKLIEIAKEDQDTRISLLIEAFAHQYRSRERQLVSQVANLEKEKEIIIARCEKLKKENAEAKSDLSYLEQRALSLVLMLKSVRASLDGPAKPPNATEAAETSRASDATGNESTKDTNTAEDTKQSDVKEAKKENSIIENDSRENDSRENDSKQMDESAEGGPKEDAKSKR